MGCCEFGREDELFPFEEEAVRFIEGIDPKWSLNRSFSVPGWKERATSRLSKFRNALCGTEEEEKLEYLERLIERQATPETAHRWLFVLESYLFPLLERLVFYRANAPEGEEALAFAVKEIDRISPTRKVKTPSEAVDALILLLSEL